MQDWRSIAETSSTVFYTNPVTSQRENMNMSICSEHFVTDQLTCIVNRLSVSLLYFVNVKLILKTYIYSVYMYSVSSLSLPSFLSSLQAYVSVPHALL